MEFVETGDGSKTLYNPLIGENYHSKHGAVQESKHVFVKTGLVDYVDSRQVKEVSVLEVGFGTGLNFLQSMEEIKDRDLKIDYHGIEGYPLSTDVVEQTEYNKFVSTSIWQQFIRHYTAAFNESVNVNDQTKLRIHHTLLQDFTSDQLFDIVYFDAFAAVHQPEMWTEEALEIVTKYIKPGGVFVTYAITGNLKRAMKALGFSIEKAPGAPGKREMLRATKMIEI